MSTEQAKTSSITSLDERLYTHSSRITSAGNRALGAIPIEDKKDKEKTVDSTINRLNHTIDDLFTICGQIDNSIDRIDTII